jgi:hypothetical protein
MAEPTTLFFFFLKKKKKKKKKERGGRTTPWGVASHLLGHGGGLATFFF